MTRGRRRWLIAGAVLVAAAMLANVIDSRSVAANILGLFAMLWLAASAWFLLWRLWRWLTYRVGVRLLISYLLVGVTPFIFAALFAVAGLWILMGQYTSVRFGSEMTRLRWQLAWECSAVLDRAAAAGAEAAVGLLEQLAARPPQHLERVMWQARLGDRELRLGGLDELPVIEWVQDGERRDIIARHDGRMFAVIAAATPSGDRVTAVVPLDAGTAAAISRAWWYDVALLSSDDDGEVGEREGDGGSEASASARIGGEFRFTVEGRTYSGDELWPEWAAEDDRLLSRPSVIWFRVTPGVVDLATGDEIEGANLLALLRSSPRAVWDDFTMSRYELSDNIIMPLAGLGSFFVLFYGFIAAIAALMILSITRSVRRLSTGAGAVERGNLDHRVPVKRRDQLGDLAHSFNVMTEAVQSMMQDVAEKERLARELDLAREIQESLLPARRMVLGPLSVRATFQPAAEVGGDYFDIFAMAEDRLIVAVGDVAGHGLSTGLLMASLKSSVAALVHEGYSGTELVDRVNHLLMENRQKRTLVTLLVVEVDPRSDRVSAANAGHPPPVLLARGSAPRELASSSLPLGSPLSRAVSLEHGFGPDGRLLLYSDGLVEAVSEDGEPFGYERLQRVLESNAGLDAEALIAAVLDALAAHTAGRPPADDLTLLVIERTR